MARGVLRRAEAVRGRASDAGAEREVRLGGLSARAQPSAGRRLDFLVAGVNKGGTTTLDSLLRRHPGIRMADVKEVHFFDDETRDWSRPDYAALHARFAEAPEGSLLGEATPATLYWPPALGRVKAYNENIRLIVLFRDPVLRAWSQWRQQRARGWEPLGFGEAIRAGRARVRLHEGVSAEDKQKAYVFGYVERGMYGRQLEGLLRLFPRERLFIETSEAFFADQPGTLARLAPFLGVEPFPPGAPLHENPTPLVDAATLSEADVAYLKAVFAEDLVRFRRLAGDLDTSRWLA